MKTTIHIPDSLLREAKSVAAKEKTTVRALVEEGLRRVVSDRRQEKPFRLRNVTFKGKGLQPGIEEGNWEQIRSMIYEGRGG
jgi:hypothetical protein